VFFTFPPFYSPPNCKFMTPIFSSLFHFLTMRFCFLFSIIDCILIPQFIFFLFFHCVGSHNAGTFPFSAGLRTLASLFRVVNLFLIPRLSGLFPLPCAVPLLYVMDYPFRHYDLPLRHFSLVFVAIPAALPSFRFFPSWPGIFRPVELKFVLIGN